MRLVVLCLSGPRIGNAEAAVLVRDDFEVSAVWAASEVRDERIAAVVSGIGAFSGVTAYRLHKAGAIVHGLPCLGAAGFVRTVIHDGDAGTDGVDKCFRVGEVRSVMVHKKEIDPSDRIVGTDQGNFLGFGQISEIEKAELAETDQDPAVRADFQLCPVPTSAP